MTCSARVRSVVSSVLSITCLVVVGVVAGGLAAGYRPVVIQTGSMGETAPPRSLIIAGPREASTIRIGDIVVMRRPDAAPVTHRVIDIDQEGARRFAITKGDANEAPDAAPYPLDDEQLVARWIVPDAGGWLQTVFRPGPALAVVGLATIVLTAQALRAIWSSPGGRPTDGRRPSRPDPVRAGGGAVRSRRQRIAAGFGVPVVVLGTAGAALALFQASDSVATNDFTTASCFDPQLGSVQRGETIHAVNGTVVVPIKPVDPGRSFVIASVRSGSDRPADSTALVDLSGAGTEVEIVRFTDAPSPPPMTIAWSVVSYDCGLQVQRGTVVGDGDDTVDVPLTAIDPAASFVLVTTAAPPDDGDVDGNDLTTTSLSATQLGIRAASGVVLDSQRRFGWQVVSFDDPGDAFVQRVSGSLSPGQLSTTVPVPVAADGGSTFLLASVRGTGSGADIGERLVRATLDDPTTVSIVRGVDGDALDVEVQVVSLRDGSSVRHGVVDVGAGLPTRTVTIDPVNLGRATAFSTVMVPGPVAGGSTDHAADDLRGEANATFTLASASEVSVHREATASNASFGWQVVEWAGPSWWDNAYTFRQRIDVSTSTVAAPDAYTVPLTFDHDALVGLDLSRADGDDVRVARWDGASWTELDRVLDDDSGWNRADTTIWFRTTEPIAQQSTISYWLHYGNVGAGAPPADPEAVHLLVETFDDGTLGDFDDLTAGGAWYSADPWTRRLPLSIPAGRVSSDLIDAPILVSVVDPDLATHAQSDGSDLRFVAADGVSELAHERVSWNAATGALEAWVRVPSVSAAAATNLYLLYGSADAPEQQSPRQVWDAGYRAVWHLDRDPSGDAPQADDVGPHHNDGSSVGTMTAADSLGGVAANALDLDGVDDGVDAAPFDVAGLDGLTVSAWIEPDTLAQDATIVAIADNATSRVVELAITTTGAVRIRLSLDGSTVEAATAGGVVAAGSWHHVAAVWDGATLRIVVDGVDEASTAAAGAIDLAPGTPVTLGRLASGEHHLDGRLDEVWIETAARSVDWLDGMRANQVSPATFLSTGPVEAGTWFSAGTWTARKPIVVDADLVAGDVVDHALLVQTVDADLAAGAAATGDDLVFTGSDGVTRLDHHVESWDPATGSLTAWVRIPLLSGSTDTSLFLYYGNPTAADQQDPVGVFGPDAELVFLGDPGS